MPFVGDVIRESLINPAVLEEFREFLVKERTATVENFSPPLWHINRYRLPKERVLALTSRLVENISNGEWYVHFYSEESDELFVVLSGRVFSLAKHRDSSWDEMLAYGDKVGVARKWIENIPVDLDA